MSRAAERYVRYYIDYVAQEPSDWQILDREYEHLTRVWNQLVNEDDILRFLWAIHTYQNRRGLYRDFLVWSERGLDTVSNTSQSQTIGVLLNNIGFVYYQLGDWARARSYLDDALALHRVNEDDLSIATTYVSLAALENSIGDNDRSFENYQKALEIYENHGADSGIAVVKNGIGVVLDQLGKWDQALAQFEQSLNIREKQSDLEGTAVTLMNIGNIYYDLGRYDEALTCFSRSHFLHRQIGNREGVANCLNNLGGTYDSLGERQQALEHYLRSIKIY